MVAKDGKGEGMVMKPTRIITNVASVAQALRGRCNGSHRHVHLVGGKAKVAATYPELLCESILTGLEVAKRRREEPELLVNLTNNLNDGKGRVELLQFDAESSLGSSRSLAELARQNSGQSISRSASQHRLRRNPSVSNVSNISDTSSL